MFGNKKVLVYIDKEVDLEIKDKKKLIIKGILGKVYKNISGKDISVIGKNKVHVGSKVTYQNLVSLIDSCVNGVTNGYYVELKIDGLGYRYILLNGKIMLRLGHSHYIEINVPKMVKIVGFRNRLVIFGLDLGSLNQFCFILKNLRKKDVYKGKGIDNANIEKKLKVGKQR